jgi:hypothetical protein
MKNSEIIRSPQASRNQSTRIAGAMSRRKLLLGGSTLAAVSTMLTGATTRVARAQQRPGSAPGRQLPNILVIFGDDIGIANLSAYSNGLMGYETPNIDRSPERASSSSTIMASSRALRVARRFSPASTASARVSPRSASPARRWA